MEQGERVALVGPNGEGKSTLVKTVMGEIAPLAGTVQTHGCAVGLAGGLRPCPLDCARWLQGAAKPTAVVALLWVCPPYCPCYPPPCRSSARIAYYQQTQVEELCARPQATALGHMQERWPAEREQALRNHLGSFGIKGATATQPLATLSGARMRRRVRGWQLCRATTHPLRFRRRR